MLVGGVWLFLGWRKKARSVQFLSALPFGFALFIIGPQAGRPSCSNPDQQNCLGMPMMNYIRCEEGGVDTCDIWRLCNYDFVELIIS